MKIFSYLLIVVAVGLIIFNATKLDFDALFEGESMVAVISIMAAACTILLVSIFLQAKKIQKKIK